MNKRPHRFGLGQASGSSGVRKLLRKSSAPCPHMLAINISGRRICSTCGADVTERKS
jgi:hypothetical protein